MSTLISEVISEDSSSATTPRNYWYRLHPTEKSGAVLAWVDENGNVILQQYNTHPSLKFNRPLIFTDRASKTKALGEKQTKEKVETTAKSIPAGNKSPATKKRPQTATASYTGSTPAAQPISANPINEDSGAEPPKKKLKTTQETASGSKAIAPTAGNPLISPNGQNPQLPFKMITPNGTEMVTRRHVGFIEGGEGGRRKELFFTSPQRPSNAGEKLHKRFGDIPESSSTSTSSSSSSSSSTSHKREPGEIAKANRADAIARNSQAQTKGGIATKIELCKRKRSDFSGAKTIMGFTAKEALRAEIDNKKNIWDKNKIELMKSLLEFSMEHLHCLAFSLSPEEYNPQTPDNLGVAGSWINTQMMVLETVAKHFAKQLTGAHEAVIITSKFDMMPNSPLIDKIYYQVLLKAKDKQLIITNTITAQALPDSSNWPSHTDASHVEIVANALLNSTAPSRTSIFSIK